MNRRLITLFIFVCIVPFSGCAQTNTSFRYNQPFDYSSLKTYSWQTNHKQKEALNQEKTDEPEIIRQTVNALLTEKGYGLSPKADFHVSYHYSTKTRHKNILSMIGIGIGSFGRYCGLESSRWHKNDTRGQLVIELSDAKHGHIFWKGTSTGKFTSNSKKPGRENYIKTMVEDIIKDIPSI